MPTQGLGHLRRSLGVGLVGRQCGQAFRTGVEIGALIKEELDHAGLSGLGGEVQWGPAVGGSEARDPRSGLGQLLGARGVAAGRRFKDVEFEAGFPERLSDLGVARQAGEKVDRPPLGVAGVGQGGVQEEIAGDGFQVPGGGGGPELLRIEGLGLGGGKSGCGGGADRG